MALLPTNQAGIFSDEEGNFVDELGSPIPFESVPKGTSIVNQSDSGIPSEITEMYESIDNPKSATMSELKQNIAKSVDYIPAIAGAATTAMLGPQAGWPAYLAVGGLTQGAVKGGLEKAQGRDFLSAETGKEALLGAAGGAFTKAIAPVVRYASGLIAKESATKGANEAVKELVSDVIKKEKYLGPKTVEKLSEIMNKPYTAGQAASKLPTAFQKTPEQLLRMPVSGSPDLTISQIRALEALRKIEPIQETAARLGGVGSNLFGQEVAQSVVDVIRDGLSNTNKTAKVK